MTSLRALLIACVLALASSQSREKVRVHHHGGWMGMPVVQREEEAWQENTHTHGGHADSDAEALVQLGRLQTRHPTELQVMRLDGEPSIRKNSESGKQEHSYKMELRQEHMSLYRHPDHSLDPAKSTPLYRPGHQHGGDDMFMMACQYDLAELPALHITAFEPVVTRVKGMTFDDSIVHHMDLFLCTDEIAHMPVETDDFPAMEGYGGNGVACDAMPWAYDRDGHKLILPDHVGVAIGKGTPYSRMVLEWHYLLDTTGVNGLKNIKDHITDHSGITLTVTPDMRKHSAATFGWIGGNMKLPPGHANWRYSITTGNNKLEQMLGHDLAKYGSVKPLAAHLHMHNHGRKSWIEHHRNGQSLGEWGRINTYKGYGLDQSFFLLEGGEVGEYEGRFQAPTAKEAVKKGDTLSMHCVFDTRCKYATPIGDPNCEKATDFIPYGLSHGQEMCGALMMYYPHDSSARFAHGNVVGYMPDDLVTDAAEYVEGAETTNMKTDMVVPETAAQ